MELGSCQGTGYALGRCVDHSNCGSWIVHFVHVVAIRCEYERLGKPAYLIVVNKT